MMLPRHQLGQAKSRRRIDGSAAAPLNQVAITSVSTDAPTASVRINFTHPVLYQGDIPPQSWSFDGHYPVTYIQKEPMFCRVSLLAAPANATQAIIPPQDPAIRTTSGGFIAPGKFTIGLAPVDILEVYVSDEFSVYWYFSTRIANGSTGTGFRINNANATSAYKNSTDWYTSYAVSPQPGMVYYINPGATDITFTNGQALAVQSGIVESRAPYVVIDNVQVLDGTDLGWRANTIISYVGATSPQFQARGNDGLWMDGLDGYNTDPNIIGVAYPGPFDTYMQWRLIAGNTAVAPSLLFLYPQSGTIEPA